MILVYSVFCLGLYVCVRFDLETTFELSESCPYTFQEQTYKTPQLSYIDVVICYAFKAIRYVHLNLMQSMSLLKSLDGVL